ncbi:hypothetical protein R1flu_009323 [Riccia fluitans]|uniref:VWFA domain-containing protein n=1 Tax=Riccia fluitans TaxID=41844 RepID=A0ABD1Z1S8_9MARC
MGPLRWKDESPGKALEDVLNLYPWYKCVSSRPPDPKKNRGSLLLGKPSKYSLVARMFVKKEQRIPGRCPSSKIRPKTPTSPRKAATKPGVDVDSRSDHKAREKSWLHQHVRDFFDDPQKQRLGELPAALVKAIWSKNKENTADKVSNGAATDDLIRKLTKLKKKDETPAECLMDVLLQSWTYFNHSHSKSKTASSHVHAKYCENTFDHFLLPDGSQVHGSYVIPLQKLITQLRALMTRLKSRVIHTDLKADVAATHFDVILYSFEAWSFGALEEERQYKLSGGPTRHWLKNLEVMQPKTPAKVNKCLTWMSKWQTGGRSNLVNALQVAFQRRTADCVYLFTDGKPERPVILTNMLKKLERERGKLIPVYPIGIGTSKRGSWFMQKIAETTGGKYQELDINWRMKVTERQGMVGEDTKWAQRMVAEEQLRSLEAGITLDVETILEKLKRKYEEERVGPCYTEFLEKERKAKENHRRVSEMVVEENSRVLRDAKRLHAELATSIQERNKEKHEHAWKIWVEQLQKVRDSNLQRKKLPDDWERLVTEIEGSKGKSIADAKKAFLKDVKRIEKDNAHQREHSMNLYEAVVKHIKDKNLKMEKDTQRRQAEIVARTEAHNRELKRQYDEKCSEIRARNLRLLEKARAEFSAACQAVSDENQRRLEEAQQEFDRLCEEVKAENLRRQNDYKAKLDELDVRMKAALLLHQDQVSTIVAEHDSNLAKISVANMTLEEDAKREWKEKCKRIDEENQRAMDKAVSRWEAACRAVQEENEQLDRRRLELLERAAEIDFLNQEIVKKRKQEWNETCSRLEIEYQREVELARKGHEEYTREVQRRNEEALEAAKVAHRAQIAAVETYNDTIRPFVESSKLVQKEIDRINLFLHHIVDKLEMPAFKKSLTSKKPSIEQRLDLLSHKEHPCHPKIICEALKAAYDEDVKSGTFPKKPPANTRLKDSDPTPNKTRSKFEGMLPISPIRVTGHHCDLSNQRNGRERSLSASEFLKKTVNRQHEIAVMIAPMITTSVRHPQTGNFEITIEKNQEGKIFIRCGASAKSSESIRAGDWVLCITSGQSVRSGGITMKCTAFQVTVRTKAKGFSGTCMTEVGRKAVIHIPVGGYGRLGLEQDHYEYGSAEIKRGLQKVKWLRIVSLALNV